MSPARSRVGSARPARSATAPLPEYLRRLGVSPRKALGQHFLIDEFALGDVADACRLDGESTVLEIGAGAGGLTEELLSRAGHVVAVELDEELAALTRRRLSEHAGLCVVAADILDFPPQELLAECGEAPPYVACGNLPYHITQPVVRRLLEAEAPPERIIVMVQREVAERMVGGEGHESLLSLSVQCYGEAEQLFDVPASAFWPPPKVRSAVVRIERLGEPAVDLPPDGVSRFFNLLRAGFAEPRKQLHNSLRSALGVPAEGIGLMLAEADIDTTKRAQHLRLDDWRRLYGVVEDHHPRALDVP